MEAYSSFAQVYDLFMDNVPYEEWSRYLISLLKEYQVTDGTVVELGCGTGKMTRLLADAGYDMVGVDNSAEMLEIAGERQEEEERNDILYLLQDMRELELFGNIRAVVSVCDSMNYIMEPEDLKKVFELALSGCNTTQIAYGMNELNLPTPGLYAKRKNLLMGSNPIIAPDSEMLWNAAIVWRILRRYEYTGALVMGRRKKIDVNTTSIRTLPEDKWIIAENAHEAIVTKDEYYQAQKAIRNVTPIQYKVGDDFALKGKICCGNCKRQLRHEKQYGEMVFCCGYKRAAGKFSKCYGGYYREYSVNAKVARAIKTVFYALDVVNQGMQEKQSITVRCMDIEDLEKQAEAIRVEQIKLYESYADGVLMRDAYIEKKKALSEKLAALQDSIRIEKEEQECADELDEEIRALTKQVSEKTYIGGLTKECVDAFVSMVYLYDDQTMKIEFNCEDVIRRALEKYGA